MSIPASPRRARQRSRKSTSLAVKAGALLVILFLPTQFALDLQLLGGLWILQTFPAVIFGLFTGWFRAHGLLAGWAAGFLGGSWLAWLNDFKPLHTLHFGAASVTLYSGLLALAAEHSRRNSRERGAAAVRARGSRLARRN